MGGGVTFSGKKRYEGSTVLALEGGGSNFLKKKRYVTLEWPHIKHGWKTM